MSDLVYIGITAATDRPDTVRSLTRYLSRRIQSSTKNLDELKYQPIPLHHCLLSIGAVVVHPTQKYSAILTKSPT